MSYWQVKTVEEAEEIWKKSGPVKEFFCGNKHGLNPFFYACRSGNLPLVAWFFERYCQDSVVGGIRSPYPIALAAKGNHFEVIEFLVSKGYEIKNSLSLFYAVKKGNLAMAKFLLDRGVNVEEYGDGSNTSLMKAIELQNKNMVQLLLENNVNPNALEEDYASPLSLAVLTNDFEIVHLLVEAGAILRNDYDHVSGLPLLEAAIRYGCDERIIALLRTME